MAEQKLQKVLQAAGLESRRTIRTDIHEGHFKVNGRIITDPNFLVDISKDTIRLDEKKLVLKIEKKCYFLFHKPLGVVSTLEDPQNRPTITDFIAKIKERVYPVGRLDYNSEGLILLTNDGDFMNFVISVRNKIPKVYMLKIKGILTDDERTRLKTKGVFLEGTRVRPLQIDFIKKTGHNNSWIRVTILEGKKHVLRKVFQYSGHPVEKLKRTAIGTFQIKSLPAGHWRELTHSEVGYFKRTYGYTEENE